MISMHYCMGQLNSTEIGYAASETCGRCGMDTEDSNGCCRDEVQLIKLQTDQLVSKVLNTSFNLPAVVHYTTGYLLASIKNAAINRPLPVYHGPPLLHDPEIYLENRVFLI